MKYTENDQNKNDKTWAETIRIPSQTLESKGWHKINQQEKSKRKRYQTLFISVRERHSVEIHQKNRKLDNTILKF